LRHYLAVESNWVLNSVMLSSQTEGLAQAFIIGEEFIGDDNVCMILGDNIFYGQGLPEKVRAAAGINDGGNYIWLLCA